MRESTMWATQGGPIIGEIRNGKKYPFGTVPATEYDADMQALRTEISGLNTAVVSCQGDLAGLTTALDVLSGQYSATVPGLSQSVADVRVQINQVSSTITTMTETLTAAIGEVDTKADNQAATISTLSSDLGSVSDLAAGTAVTTAANSEAITGIRDSINSMWTAITANGTAINAVNAAITELTATQSTDRATLTARIQAAENSVTALAQTVEGINTTLSNQISGLRADMTVNSQDIAVIKSTLQTQGAEIQSAEDRCTAVENRMNAQEVGMATLRQQLLNSVMNIENEIEQIVTDKTAIKADIADITAAIDEYETVTNATLQEHNARIARLEGGDPPEIVSFTATPNICELGGRENVILSWNVTGGVDKIMINGETVTGTSKTYADVHEATDYTLTASDAAGNTVRSTVSVDFVNHLFWGVSATATPSEGVVKALDNTEMSDVRTRTIHVSPYNEYIYYAYPKRLGTSEFRVNGFTGGFENPAVVSVDNHSEYIEDYYVYRSTNKLSGTLDVEII